MLIDVIRQYDSPFRALLEHSTEALALVSQNGIITYASPSTEQVTGYAAEELEGLPALPLVHPDDVEQVQTAADRVLPHLGASASLVYRLRSKDGSFRWMEGTLVNHLATTTIGAVGVHYRDITAYQHLIQERDEARRQEQAASEAQHRMDAFIGVMIHEVKSPLTTIKGNLQLALRRIIQASAPGTSSEGCPPCILESIQTLLERAERQVRIQNRLVNDLLDMARIQTQKLEVHPEPLDLVSLLREGVEDQRLTVPDRLISFEASVSSCWLLADSERITQVLVNYLSNALKYSPPDSPVTVRLVTQQTLARVEVTDRGPGLSEEQQQRVWERFYRVPERAGQEGIGGGLGLGLAICRSIIALHHGETGVQSTPGEGSTFWFVLPLSHEAASSASTDRSVARTELSHTMPDHSEEQTR